jgi:Domain of unknown function (DUF4189)
MKNLTRGILLIVFALALGLAPALQAAPGDRFAAIAYSPRTGRWGSGSNYPTKSGAIVRALRECGSRGAQSFWCRNSWIAVAVSNRSPGGFGWAYGDSAYAARNNAIRQCLARNPDAHVVTCVSAYGY